MTTQNIEEGLSNTDSLFIRSHIMVGLHSYMDMLQVKFDVGLNSFIEPTIGDKSVETLYLNRVTSENKRICTPPLSPTFKVGVFVVFCWQLEQGHNIARRGWGRKAIFLLLKLIKHKKSPVLGEVSQLILSAIVG